MLAAWTYPGLGLAVFFVGILITFLTSIWSSHQNQDEFLKIFVLSAREHFEARYAIRSSWGSHIPSDVTIQFVIGAACLIHPDDRLDEYGCDFWNFDKVPDERMDLEAFQPMGVPADDVITSDPVTDTGEDPQLCYLRDEESVMDFTVLHPIVTTSLGVHHACFRSSNESSPVEVHLRSRATQAVVFTISNFLNKNVSSSYFRYSSSPAYVLPKGFQGSVGFSNTEDILCECGSDVASSQPVNTSPFLFMDLPKSPHRKLLNFKFKIQDSKLLGEHVLGRNSREEAWARLVAKEEWRLNEEGLLNGDLLRIPLFDTYRNIPRKLMETIRIFADMERSHESVPYFLKADDDSFVNTTAVRNWLREVEMTGKTGDRIKDKLIFGNFRRHWAVQRAGKWEERGYPGLSYPDFPCGSAYILSFPLANWIGQNSDHLWIFQGEDTSMGIWAAAVLPSYIQDERFLCSRDSELDRFGQAIFSMPDLTPEEIVAFD